MDENPGGGQYVTYILIGAMIGGVLGFLFGFGIGGVPGFIAGAVMGGVSAKRDPFNLFV